MEFKELLGLHSVVAVIEGTTEAPGSPASVELVELLKGLGVKYAALDVT